jgi:hypothetical protein
MASFVWLGALALFVWLARASSPGVRDGAGIPDLAGEPHRGGLLLWATVFSGARWMERKLELRPEAFPVAQSRRHLRP